MPDSRIRQRGPVSCLTRSPEYTSLDFFLWYSFENKVFEISCTRFNQSKRRITSATQNTCTDILQEVRQKHEKLLCFSNMRKERAYQKHNVI